MLLHFYLNKSQLFCFTRFVWEEELRLRMPDVPVTRMYVLTKTNEQFIDPAVVIISYDLMTKKKEMLLNFKFGIIVFVSCRFLVYRILFYFQQK